jgi:hypothetical protein
MSVRLQSDTMGFSASISETLPMMGRPGGPVMGTVCVWSAMMVGVCVVVMVVEEERRW